MKKYLSLVEYAFWYGTLFLQLVACWAVLRRRGFLKHWKAFSYYLFFMCLQSLVLLGVAYFGSASAYSFTYYLVDFVEAILINLVVLEVLVQVLDPFEALPGRTVARFCFWAVFGVAAAVALSIRVPSAYHDMYVAIERTIFLADAVLLWLLLLQSKSLGLTWKTAQAEIAIGFVLYLTVQATSRLMGGTYTDPMLRRVCGEVGQLAYLIALIAWIWTLTHREPMPARPSREVLAKLENVPRDEEIVPKERILAAIGVRINKPSEEETKREEERRVTARLG